MLADVLLALYAVYTNHPCAVLAAVCAVAGLYKLVVHPLFLSPLKDIPGPYAHRISYLPSLNAQRKHTWIQAVHALHQKYGPVVVLSPGEVSCNGDAKYIADIYVKNMPKTRFYENFRNHGSRDNIFASLENDRHVRYKRMVQNLYSKSAVFSGRNTTRATINDKVRHLVRSVHVTSVSARCPDLINARSELNEFGKGHANSGWFHPPPAAAGMDVYSLFGALAMDVVSAFELGPQNGTDLLVHPEKRSILVPHRMQAGMVFWTTQMPRLWAWAAGPAVRQASATIEKWQLGLYARAEANVPRAGQNLTTLETLKKNGLRGKDAYSFITDNIFAGHETTAIQLTYLCYELSRPCHSDKQARLRDELRGAFGPPPEPAAGDGSDTADLDTTITDFEAVDRLPYLEALMQENSRVHASIPGAEPRVTPAAYAVDVGGKTVLLPPGTGISCQPYSMHRVEAVFPQADAWLPERWLPGTGEAPAAYSARMAKMQKYMMPFGKGVRMCLGMNVAVIEMKLAIANLYWRYSSALCPEWCDVTRGKPGVVKMGSQHMVSGSDESMMTMVDSYTTRPYYDECWLEWSVAP